MKEQLNTSPASSQETEATRRNRKLRAGSIGTWEIVLSAAGNTVFVSDNFLHLFGHTPSETTRDWDVMLSRSVYPGDHDRIRAELAGCLRDPEGLFRVECRMWSKKDNDWRWAFIFGSVDEASPEGSRLRLSGYAQDIHERIQAERSRDHGRALNEALTAALPGPYLITNAEGSIIHWNHNFENSFLMPQSDAARGDCSGVFVEHDRPKILASLEQAKTVGFASTKARAPHPDGSERIYHCQMRRFNVGETLHVVNLPFDVTEQYTTQAELRKERSRLDTIINAANLGTWDWNIVTSEVTYNKIWADIAGVNLQDIQGSVQAWKAGILADDLPGAMAEVEAHCRGEAAMYESEFRMRRGDGEVIWALDLGRVVEWDEQGAPIRLMGILQDITATKKAALELERNTKQLELMVHASGLGLWDWTPQTNSMHFKSSFYDMIGYPPEERALSYEMWMDLVHPDDVEACDATLQNLLSGAVSSYECEARIRHKNGEYIWTCDVGRAVEWDKEGKPTRVLGGLFNIQKLKELAEERAKALATVAEQKDSLEADVRARTHLLHEMQRRLDAVLRASGEQEPARPSTLAGDEEHAAEAPSTREFAASMNGAFDLITEKMWWYKAIIDSIPFPLFVSDTERRWTYLNNPALETFGASSLAEVLGKQRMPWKGEENAPDPFAEAGPEGGSLFNRYHPVLERHFQGQASYLYDQAGARIGHVEAMRDVSREYEADKRTRIMMDASPLACYFFNDALELIDCNPVAPKLFGLSGKEAFLSSFCSLHPSHQPGGGVSTELIARHLREAFATGRKSFDWLHQHPDGTPLPTEMFFVRVEYNKKHTVLGYVRDLTELKRKEEEVDRERRLLLQIMESSPVAFVILVEGHIRFATPYATRFFGVDVGGDIADFYTDTVERKAFFAELEHTGFVAWRVVSVTSADGSPKEMLANAFMAEYYGERCVMSWFLDVTKMRESERQLRMARDAAQESTRAKSDFLANMSHEIRTPMNAILGMTRIVLETELGPLQRGYLEKAEYSARTLLRILNDILDFSKIEAGKLEMEEVPFSLLEVLQNIMDMFAETAEAKGLLLSLNLPERLPLAVTGDPLRLSQICTNLVGNAIKFTAQGHVSLSVRVTAWDDTNISLLFRVTDTGIGLSKSQLGKLFSAFSQADTSTTRRYGGTGLGLAISKSLITMMRGEIFCSSREGDGTEFSFSATLPLAEAKTLVRIKSSLGLKSDPAAPPQEEKRTGAAAERQEAARAERVRDIRVLVAEDNEINQIIVRQLLEKADIIVDLAENGIVAVQMALRNRYDLIFMDIQMPEMDGLAATRELRRHSRLNGLPIVAMTAHAMVGDREKSLAVGMNDHITKPLDVKDVLNIIARWIPRNELCTPLPSHAASSHEQGNGGTAAAGQRETIGNPAAPQGVKEISGQGPGFVPVEEHAVSELPSFLPGVDIAAGLPRVAGNKKLYVKLLLQVAGESQAMQEKFTEAVMAGDAGKVRELAHSLKGSSANLAITEVAQAAEHLENAAKTGDFSILFIHLDALEQALQRFRESVSGLSL